MVTTKKEKKVSLAKPSGIAEDPPEIEARVGELASEMARVEATQKAKALLRKEAKAIVKKRLGGSDVEKIGVVFRRPWKMYQPGHLHSFSLSLAEALVEAGIARLDGDPKPKPKEAKPPTQAKKAKGGGRSGDATE